jgi:hypothetical protein
MAIQRLPCMLNAGSHPIAVTQVGVTRTLENAEYKVGEVNKVGPGSQ